MPIREASGAKEIGSLQRVVGFYSVSSRQLHTILRRAAAEWAAKRMEPWDFGHPGWLNERLSAHAVVPRPDADAAPHDRATVSCTKGCGAEWFRI